MKDPIARASVYNAGTQTYSYSDNGTPQTGTLSPNGRVDIVGRQAFLGIALTPVATPAEDEAAFEDAGLAVAIVVSNKGATPLYCASNGNPSKVTIQPNRAAQFTPPGQLTSIAISVSNNPIQEADLPQEQTQEATQ